MDACSTHEVFNQSEPLADYNLYETDAALREAVAREGAGAWDGALHARGAHLGRRRMFELGALANAQPPMLATHDPQGRRIDQVRLCPAWHELLADMAGYGLHSGAWAQPSPGAQVARAAAFLMQGQVEAGSLCPVTMTFGALAVLRQEPAGVIDYAGLWLPRLMAPRYDRRDLPVAAKHGALLGMGLTEKQGGSDVRANTTRAEPVAGAGQGQAYLLRGHKWFYSVPQSDAHLVLAQAAEGPSCFFVPRRLPDGRRNAQRLMRLKDKLGNRSNASAEVEFQDAWGAMVGEPGRGIATLIKVASYTRLDCALGSAALLRQALVRALHHACGRRAFGKPLIEHPLMRNVLCDLTLESEAATALALRLARAFDRAQDPAEQALARLGTPAAKLWICKRTIAALAECMEVLGGNGYVEESMLARLYREAPVNSIWEGAGNIMALDVLRALQRHPQALPALRDELLPARGQFALYDEALRDFEALAASAGQAQGLARRLAARLACLWQAALLIRHAPAPVAQAFVLARLGEPAGLCGGLPAQACDERLLRRAWPPIC
ncbi:isovaleryl-CoA dehydrogenase [Orrella sp. JC864]|uniref:isovaleryl-CoA dehydrogenase n=1 Tax=Orrella sp. JC864 TaxID=3120298 RepID=UPI003009EA6D